MVSPYFSITTMEALPDTFSNVHLSVAHRTNIFFAMLLISRFHPAWAQSYQPPNPSLFSTSHFKYFSVQR